jgi:hypothetical protein
MIGLVSEKRSGFHRFAQKASRFARMPLGHESSIRHTLSTSVLICNRHRGLRHAPQTAFDMRQDAGTPMTDNPAGTGEKTNIHARQRPQMNRWNWLLAGVIVLATVAAVVLLMQFR